MTFRDLCLVVLAVTWISLLSLVGLVVLGIVMDWLDERAGRPQR